MVPICDSLIDTWKPRTATLLDQSSNPYASPSCMETPGRLSTTDVTAVMFDCWSIIGSATTFRAKIVGSSATTLTASRRKATGSWIATVSVAPAPTETRVSTVS